MIAMILLIVVMVATVATFELCMRCPPSENLEPQEETVASGE